MHKFPYIACVPVLGVKRGVHLATESLYSIQYKLINLILLKMENNILLMKYFYKIVVEDHSPKKIPMNHILSYWCKDRNGIIDLVNK